jgi:hypothetical protein
MVLAFFLQQTSVFAQTYQKPSVPEFTARYVERSNDVAPTYTFDPFTGKNVISQQGYRGVNRTIEISIKNPPFTPNTLPNGTTISLFYDVRSKPQFGNTWNSEENTPMSVNVAASNSEYTIISYDLSTYVYGNLEYGDNIDFQVRSRIGFMYPNIFNGYFYQAVVDGDWSGTQTITISTPATSYPFATAVPTSSEVPAQSPTATSPASIDNGSSFNLNSEQTALVIAFVMIAVLAIALIAMWHKKQQQAPKIESGSTNRKFLVGDIWFLFRETIN